MYCVSISADAATTSPIWYWINANDFISGSGDSEGYYISPIDGTKWAIVYPGQYDPINGFRTSDTLFTSIKLNKCTFPDTATQNNELTGYVIGGAWEPYSYYNFTIDSSWRVCASDLYNPNNYLFCFANKNDLADIDHEYPTLRNIVIMPNSSTGGYTAYENSHHGFSYKTRFYPLNTLGLPTSYDFADTFNGTNNTFSTVAMSDAYSHGDTLAINDLIVWAGFNGTPTEGSYSEGQAVMTAQMYLMCPKALVPKGLKPGDIWPIGNVLSPHTSEEENAVNQYSGDKETIETVGEVLDNGIESVTDIYSIGIGDSETTNIDLITSLFSRIFPWMLDIFGLMFLFGVLGVVIRRALHD